MRTTVTSRRGVAAVLTAVVTATILSAVSGSAAARPATAQPATARPVAARPVAAQWDAAGTTVVRWELNERPGATIMYDSGGNRLHGRIGGEVATGVRTGSATGYRFRRLTPNQPPTHPRHLVTVPHHEKLDPGDRDFIIALRLRTTASFGNVVQKGQSGVKGGNYKIQNPGGRIQCLFHGSRGSMAVWSRDKLDDGRWHTIVCRRAADALTMHVDGRLEARKEGFTGHIANSWPVSIAGKVSCDQVKVGCDYFAGDIDWVRMVAR